MSGKPPEKLDAVQAVVVASFFHRNFWPAADGADDSCLVPLVNRPLLHYALDLVEAAGVADVVLFSTSGAADGVRALVRSDPALRRLNVVYTSSDTCRSLGDVLRHLDACALIRDDFVLLWGDVVGSLPLLPLVRRFKALRRRDRGAVMTLLYQRGGGGGGGQTLVLASDTGRVLHHNRAARGRIALPVDLVLGGDDGVQVRRDLSDTGVAVCSTAVPCLFADNFDFQTADDFVRGLLLNEEILNSTLYAHVLDGGGGYRAGRASDWPSYQRVTRDVLHRWTYPQVPEILGRYGPRYGQVYLGDGATLALTCAVGDDTVIGPRAKLGANARVSGSVVGPDCAIGDNAVVENSYLFGGARVGDGCVVRCSVVGENCAIGENSTVSDGCVLGGGVVVVPNSRLARLRVHRSNVNGKMEELSADAYAHRPDDDDGSDDERVCSGLRPSDRRKRSFNSFTSSSSSSDEDDDDDAASVPDDMCMFYSEVVDSLIRGFEDHVHCDNLILEINSSRYAYNINYREANFQVIRAMLTMNGKAESTPPPPPTNQVRYFTRLMSQLDYFLPVLRNYIKSTDSYEDCLSAIEDVAKTEEMLNTVAVKVIHHLYTENVLSEESILRWHQKDGDSQFARGIRKKADKLIEWLKDAEEETDSDDSS